jgi:hypothetical protein
VSSSREVKRYARNNIRPIGGLLVVAVGNLVGRDSEKDCEGMTGMIQADTADAPTPEDFSSHSLAAQVGLSWSKGELINAVGSEVVTNVKDARPDLTFEAINILWTK